MGLFKKKIDHRYDSSIRAEWNLDKDCYCFYRGSEEVPLDNLNWATKRHLKKMNKLTEEEKENRRQIARNYMKAREMASKSSKANNDRLNAGYPSNFLSAHSFEVFGKTNDDAKKKFSLEVLQNLEELTDEKKNTDYIVGIHRIGGSEEHLPEIFNQGIKVQGHMMGAAKGIPTLDNTVGYYSQNATIIKEVAYANTYKNSRGSIVVKIPKEDIIQNSIFVTDEKEKDMYLDPKYIVGYFPIEDDGRVTQIITGDNLGMYMKQRKKEAEEYIKFSENSNTKQYPPIEK